MHIQFMREVSKKVLMPLALIYCIGLFLVYNSLGGLLGISFGIYALVANIAAVVAFCAYAVYLAWSQIDDIASKTNTPHRVRQFAKFFIAAVASSLLLSTSHLASQIGLTYA